MFELAKTVQLETKAVLDHCRDLGFDVKNQLSSLEREQVDALKGRIFGGEQPNKSLTPDPGTLSSTPKTERKIHTLPTPPRKTEAILPNPSVVRVVVPPLTRAQPQYLPQKNQGIESLLNVAEAADLGKLECIPLLAEIDVEAAMFKVRQITERLCRKILRAAGVKEKELSNLNAMIDAIASRKLLTPKAVHHLDSIRALGNGATHNTDDLFAEEFTLHDVNSASSSLASVLDAAIKTGKL